MSLFQMEVEWLIVLSRGDTKIPSGHGLLSHSLFHESSDSIFCEFFLSDRSEIVAVKKKVVS